MGDLQIKLAASSEACLKDTEFAHCTFKSRSGQLIFPREHMRHWGCCEETLLLPPHTHHCLPPINASAPIPTDALPSANPIPHQCYQQPASIDLKRTIKRVW